MAKVWLITGSGNGLGRDIAEAALAAGDNVVAGARRTEESGSSPGPQPRRDRRPAGRNTARNFFSSVWPSAPRAHAGLADIDAEFEQFTVNSWRSPGSVGFGHLADEGLGLRGDLVLRRNATT